MSAIPQQFQRTLRHEDMPQRGGIRWRAFGSWLIKAEANLMFLFLYIPIIILIVYSFNASRYVSSWDGFTLNWYRALFIGESGGELLNAGQIGRGFDSAGMFKALQSSLLVAVVSTIIATALGTTAALAMERFRFRLQGAVDVMLYLPIVIPEITMGISLVVFFQMLADVLGTRSLLGYPTIIIGHVAFNISFVAVVVRARLAGMDRSLEEAAQDAGANEWQTFRRIVLPLIMPGILGGALLAFTLSLDDFVITFFTSGIGTSTLPIFVYSMIRFGVSPAVNAISTLMLAASILLVIVSLLLQRR